MRFFSYIQNAIEGGKSCQTVLDAWTGVTASNAVIEIISASSRLETWFYTPRKNGKIPLHEFMMERSVGRLHGATIYDETVEILREMLKEDGLGEYFDSVIASQGYFPESLFYQFVGYPENIFLYHPVHEKLKNRFG